MSSFAPDVYIIGDNRYVTDFVNLIEESLTIHIDKSRNKINFANDIMTNRIHIKVEQHLIYSLKIWNKKDNFYILNEISKNVTLAKLMDILGNVNHAISIVGYWIFGSNYEKALFPTKESLDLVFSPSVGGEQVAKFESVFTPIDTCGHQLILK